MDSIWKNLEGWQKGAVIGLTVYSFIFLLALLLCAAEYLGITPEGYVGAGWLLLIFGLPVTAIEAFLEAFNLSFLQQMINLFVLAFVNWLAIGVLVGCFSGRGRRRGR